ncbi:MAG: PadR family transcriptional regulator [Candidatus Izimaplasma sp.]|nr:PadR family transcriptional regulator [Candidatus Izimaplasma bacterium]
MNSQMKKGVIELCIMKIIDLKKSSTYEILNQIHNLKVNENTIYPILRRLNKEGYLDQEKGNNAVGAPRKYYKLTEVGEKKLEELSRSWEEFYHSVERILKGEINDE